MFRSICSVSQKIKKAGATIARQNVFACTQFIVRFSVCVCVCERESESECVCVNVCARTHVHACERVPECV